MKNMMTTGQILALENVMEEDKKVDHEEYGKFLDKQWLSKEYVEKCIDEHFGEYTELANQLKQKLEQQ